MARHFIRISLSPDDEERALVLGVLFEELLAWTRSLPGSQRLRALCIFDEVYGFLPPHPANPPTKRPLVAPRWFLVRDVHTTMGLALLQPRWTMSWMRGPMTRSELRTALGE